MHSTRKLYWLYLKIGMLDDKVLGGKVILRPAVRCVEVHCVDLPREKRILFLFSRIHVKDMNE